MNSAITNPKSKIANPKSLVLGIDTGGTYTDGALLDYDSRRVLASCKSLTTKRDLSLGIEAVIERIAIDDPAAIKLVSISTTLATNAIAEGKGKRVALLLIGYDPDLVASFKMESRFATPHFYYFAGGHDLFGQEKEPLDLPGILARVEAIKDQVEAIAVSGYFSPLNPEHEERVYQAISGVCDLPVVLGHQLSTKLGSIERATTAALNASLLAVLQDFIKAVQQALARRRIVAPLMVVRGDGTLMSDDFAARTPVETIHSGPAASAMGGRYLSRLDEALVIDIGGTTTDIALIRGGQVAVSEAGATVNGYKTSVQAANLLTIALGGDSHLTLSRSGDLVIGPERVLPVAHLARQYPQVRPQLNSLSRQMQSYLTPDWLEYWFLLREPKHKNRPKTEQQKKLVELLRADPQPLPKILEQLGVLHRSQLNVGELLRQEVIGKAGLTPTDLLHVEGRYAPWDVEAAALALETLSRLQGQAPAQLRRQVWAHMTETIVLAAVTFLSGKVLPPVRLNDDDLGRWFFENSLSTRPDHPHLATSLRLRQPIIGIGAPAAIFLPEVAAALQTELILPEHHAVANAAGAVAGSVMVAEEVLIYPRLSSEGLEVIGYTVQNSAGRREYEALEAALAHARVASRDRALAAARHAGADNPQVVLEELVDGLDTFRVRAKALGSPRLGG